MIVQCGSYKFVHLTTTLLDLQTGSYSMVR